MHVGWWYGFGNVVVNNFRDIMHSHYSPVIVKHPVVTHAVIRLFERTHIASGKETGASGNSMMGTSMYTIR